MNKPKLCPFCGSEVNTAYRSGGVCVVSCHCCRADGPVVMVEDFLDRSEEVTNEAWNEAVEKAKAAAVEKWNTRPPMTNVTMDDLTTYEKISEEYTQEAWNEVVKRAKAKYEKTHSAALYGANCREG